MILNYTNLDVIVTDKPSIFLAGPTPRDEVTVSWRKRAVDLLEELKFEGIVYIPEDEVKYKNSYLDQVEWEKKGLHSASVIVFWIDRELSVLPGFTTNVEFGYWVSKDISKVVYGRPDEALKNKYLDWLYKSEGGSIVYNDLRETLQAAISLIEKRGIKDFLI